MIVMNEIRTGDQVAYIPNHADSINHPDVEFGFVTSVNVHTEGAFVRYWHNSFHPELRTKGHSERTPLANLVRHMSHTQNDVDNLLRELKYTYTPSEFQYMPVTLQDYDIDTIKTCIARVRHFQNLLKKYGDDGTLIYSLDDAVDCLLDTLESRLVKMSDKKEGENRNDSA